MQRPVFINHIVSLSALGSTPDEVWSNLNKATPKFQKREFHDSKVMVSAIPQQAYSALEALKNERKLYNTLDRSALMAIYVGRKLFEGLLEKTKAFGINIGSSRGATQTFEAAHQTYLQQQEVSIMTSPMTTLGNIATSVAQDLGLQGPAISHSITCSSALHALLNAIAFLQSGMLSNFIVGGTESPLTGFTIAQMQALKLYAKHLKKYACRSLDFSKTENTLVLGEASCLASLSTEPDGDAIKISGIGYATENIKHSVALSAQADCLKLSMQMALKSADRQNVDVIVMHAPGTVKGDKSELKAIENSFKTIPALTTNKWLIGHTFGTSGAMSLEMAILMLKKNCFIPNPFYKNMNIPKDIESVMVNAVGFGGNAISVILENNIKN